LPDRNCLEKKITFESVKSYKALSLWLFLPRECLFQQLIKQKNTSLLDYATFLFIILALTYIGMNEWMTKYLCKMTKYLWCKMTCIFCFRYIELRNGVRVLLASNPKALTSGAGLDIRVGSFHDPVRQSFLYQTFNTFKSIMDIIFLSQ